MFEWSYLGVWLIGLIVVYFVFNDVFVYTMASLACLFLYPLLWFIVTLSPFGLWTLLLGGSTSIVVLILIFRSNK